MITVDEVRQSVAMIREMKDDNEAAHHAEKRLWEVVLASIVEGAENPAALAVAALATNSIEFSRWYA